MKILLTFPSGPHKEWEGEAYVERVRQACLRNAQNNYLFVEDADAADIIIYFEPDYFKKPSYVDLLLAEPHISQFPNKCFTINTVDKAFTFLPGVYVSLEKTQSPDRTRFRSGCYSVEQNPLGREHAENREVEPQLLFSFRGANSHSVREKLFADKDLAQQGAITRMYRWFDHTEDEQHLYFAEMVNSKFVLCPRGLSPSSHRLYEVMELGRVPVIISDEWIAPDGPRWSDFSLQIAESNLKELPSLLQKCEPEAARMGRLARSAWERWFAPSQRALTNFSYLEDLLRQRGSDYDERLYQRQWKSRKFYQENEWLVSQRVWNKIRKIGGKT